MGKLSVPEPGDIVQVFDYFLVIFGELVNDWSCFSPAALPHPRARGLPALQPRPYLAAPDPASARTRVFAVVVTSFRFTAISTFLPFTPMDASSV